MSNKFNLLFNDFADVMVSEDGDPMTLLQKAVRPSSPGELEASDYVHMAPSLVLLRTYLDAALPARRKGVNVLLHGKPGTGKNQLVKLMARELGYDLLEVVSR